MRAEISMSMKNNIILLYLAIQCLVGYCADAPINSNNVAQGKTVLPTIKNASYVLDGDESTCIKTDNSSVYVTIDLGEEKIVSGLLVSAGTAPGDALGYIEVLVGSDSTGKNGGICKYHSPSSSKKDYLECVNLMKGRFVTLKNPGRGGMKFCLIEVRECKQGFFNKDCSGVCHCLNNSPCSVLDTPGYCASGCAAGYMGSNCSTSCKGLNKFGVNCAKTCHCNQNIQCDEVTGSCSGGCAEFWKGDDCQTKKPSLKGVTPKRDDATFNSITIKWQAWNNSVGTGFSLWYKIMMKEYACNEGKSCWKEATIISHKVGVPDQDGKVQNLKLNTRYNFQIIPLLRKENGDDEEGSRSDVGGPYKTKCIAPQAPTIENIERGVDRVRHSATATLTVTWKPPADDHCDDIALYKIQYSEVGTSIWNVEKASRAATSKEIFGLEFESQYQLMVVAVNNEDLNGNSELRTVQTLAENEVVIPGESGNNNVTVIVSVVLGTIVIMACVIIFVVLRHRRKRYRSLPPKDPEEINGMTDPSSLNSLRKLEKEHTPTNDSGVLIEDPCSHTPSSSAESFAQIKDPPSVRPACNTTPEPVRKPVDRFPIKVEDLEDYVMERRDNDCKALKDEYREFPEGIQLPCEHGRKQENKHKNRFINIIAYDHSIVKLEPMEGDEDSDYINANYVHGYKKENHYIASQGCNKWTIQDIWRMAWQKGSHRILMVTNLIESGKRKCEQYWPEHMNEEKQYNEVFIKWVDCEQTSDFVIRTFELRKEEEIRNLKQFHFTAWPDHGVPNRASPIIAFRRKVRSFDESHPGPMIIHCSAGVGRTGTFINIDYNLEMAKDDEQVDVYNVTKEMRGNRVNMIQTEEQYIFVYDALLEALQTGDTAIPCSEFRMEFELLCKEDEEDGKSKLQKEFENLQSVSPKVKVEDCEAASKPENIEKNRDSNILPADRHRPYLNTRVQGTNDFINAVFLDGYKSRNAHIITQMPLPNTVIDFWRMVYEHNCGSIVMLNSFDASDETSGQYWPEDTSCECGPFIIEPVEMDDKNNTDIIVRELKLKYQPKSSSNISRRGEVRTVNLFQYQAWPKEDNLPTNKTSLMSLIDLVERSQYKTGNGPVLIHCYNGASQSGLYAAISCIWEKMKLEQEVDIYHTVKQLRYHRPQVIENLDQYKFCFEMVLAFLAEFETYANFR